MSLDYQQVKRQITEMGESAIQRSRLLASKFQDAMVVLQTYATDLGGLQKKVDLAILQNEKLRCALPGNNL